MAVHLACILAWHTLAGWCLACSIMLAGGMGSTAQACSGMLAAFDGHVVLVLGGVGSGGSRSGGSLLLVGDGVVHAQQLDATLGVYAARPERLGRHTGWHAAAAGVPGGHHTHDDNKPLVLKTNLLLVSAVVATVTAF